MNMFLSVGVVAHRRPVGWRRRALLGIESSTRDSTPLEEYSSRESPPLQRVLLNSFGEHRETGSSCGTEGALFGRLERQGWAVGYERAPPLGGPTGCPLLGGGAVAIPSDSSRSWERSHRARGTYGYTPRLYVVTACGHMWIQSGRPSSGNAAIAYGSTTSCNAWMHACACACACGHSPAT